jgi:hypothetical protein
MKPGLYNEQKCSQLLSKDENESVLQLLGPKCQVNYLLLFIIDRIFHYNNIILTIYLELSYGCSAVF